MTIDELYDLVRARCPEATRDGAALSAGGYIDLGSLTSLPDGVTLSAGGFVYGQLTQPWHGQQLRSHDGIVSVVTGETHTVGECEVTAARYWRGANPPGDAHFIAVRGEHSAHGATVRGAVEDCMLKALQSDPSSVVAEIRATGRVTVAQYRAITGACREGCRMWLTSQGLDGVESLPLEDVLQRLNGAYGAERFRDVVACMT